MHTDDTDGLTTFQAYNKNGGKFLSSSSGGPWSLSETPDVDVAKFRIHYRDGAHDARVSADTCKNSIDSETLCIPITSRIQLVRSIF